MALPVEARSFTDFYSSKNHAVNVGTIFRGKDNALNPNWVHMPIAYNGKASSIVISGTDIRRPQGQINQNNIPVWAQTNKLDFEIEIAAIVGKSSQIGHPIAMKEADDYIFGFVMLNDWSARDIQVWEYVPLGPFNSKNFATTISPWIITVDALEPFKIKLPQ